MLGADALKVRRAVRGGYNLVLMEGLMRGGGKHLAASGALADSPTLRRGRVGMGALRPEVLCCRLLRKALELLLPSGVFLQGQALLPREVTC